MTTEAKHLRHVMLYEFQRHGNASLATKNISEVYENGPKLSTCKKWFKRFRNGDFDLKDRQRTGRPTEVDNDVLKSLVESNPGSTTRELADKMDCSFKAISVNLKKNRKSPQTGRFGSTYPLRTKFD